MTRMILVVGAGGIGCELLKNLAFSGFQEIHVCHVGKSKALVAAESIKAFNDSIIIIPYHKSIYDPQFSQSFYRQFDLVFGALDNHDLIESGTAGYQGQVEPFIFSDQDARTDCYECKSREAGKKTYPTCTIRNTPSEPVHCVVWSKNLFTHLFGQPDEDDEDFTPDFKDPELNHHASETHSSSNKNNIWETLSNEVNELDVDQRVSLKVWNKDIQVLKNMSSLWDKKKSRKEPKCLDLDFIKNSNDVKEFITNSTILKDHQIVELKNWLYLFHDSCKRLRNRVGITNSSHVKTDSLMWDKDDEDAMDFVAAASIIRCHIFQIEKGYKHTIFDLKQIAGSIIPAISTTNAIIAGIMVLQAKKILNKQTINEVYLKTMKRVIEPIRKNVPNPSCLVCSKESTNSVHLIVIKDFFNFTLGEIVDDILTKVLGMSEPEIYLVKKGSIIYSADPDDGLESNLKKSFKDFDINPNEETVIRCEDARQELQILINIHNISNNFENLQEKLNFIHCKNLMATNETEIDNLDKIHENMRWILVKEDIENGGTKRSSESKKRSTEFDMPDNKKSKIDNEVILL